MKRNVTKKRARRAEISPPTGIIAELESARADLVRVAQVYLELQGTVADAALKAGYAIDSLDAVLARLRKLT